METFTDEQMKALYTRVMDRMLEVGWLASYTFTDGKGFHLNWTPVGCQRSMLLKALATAFNLTSDDRAPIAFDKIAHGESLPDYARPFEMEAHVAKFWCECSDGLQLRGDADALLALVRLVIDWAPDDSTPIKFVLPD